MNEPRIVKWVFADGGVIQKNPSTIGGVWAWCGVASDGEHLREQFGYLLPDTSECPGWPRVGSRIVTNNDSEFYASLRALEGVPPGWSGALVTDSQVTIDRWFRLMEGEHLMAFRLDWQHRAYRALARSDGVRLIHVAGHPNQQDLARGFTVKDGEKVKVSRHNVWCDATCTELSRAHERNLGWTDFADYPFPLLPSSQALAVAA